MEDFNWRSDIFQNLSRVAEIPRLDCLRIDSPITGLSLPEFPKPFVVGKEGGFTSSVGKPPTPIDSMLYRVGLINGIALDNFPFPKKRLSPHSSWTDNHMDLFVVAENQRIHHTWWDINANEGKWHDWTPISQPGVIFPKRTPITAVSPRPGHIDLFCGRR